MFWDKMLQQKYVGDTHCQPICSDNYIQYKVFKGLGKWLQNGRTILSKLITFQILRKLLSLIYKNKKIKISSPSP